MDFKRQYEEWLIVGQKRSFVADLNKETKLLYPTHKPIVMSGSLLSRSI